MKKKGFTLVELLGVILILALLALLITPVVTGIIRSSRTKSNDAQKQLIIDAAKLWVTDNDTKLSSTTGSEYTLYVDDIQRGGYLSDTQIVNIEKEVSIANACVIITTNTKKYDYELVENCGINYASVTPVYFNPETNKKCDSTSAVSTTNTKTGCMKWYIIGNSGDNINVILDHNTTALVAYNSNNVNTTANEIKTSLANDIKTWDGNVSSTARLITADEVASLTANNAFNSSTTTANTYYFCTNTSLAEYSTESWYSNIGNTLPDDLKAKNAKYSFLFDYTYNCSGFGCTTEDNNGYTYGSGSNTSVIRGYWTSSVVAGSTTALWRVTRVGGLVTNNANNSSTNGVRPVITIPKSLFN